MKIGLLTHSLNARGGVVHVLELGRALLARGHDVTVFAPAAPGQRPFRATPCRIELAPVDPGGKLIVELVLSRIAALRTHLAALLRRERFDVLHAHDGIGGNSLADLVREGAIGGYLRTVHHLDRFGDQQLQAWEDRSIRGAAQVLCVSEVWRQRLFNDHAIVAAQVPNGVDLTRFSPHAGATDEAVATALGLGARRPVILSVGGIEARKNTTLLVKAFAIARERLPDAQLVIAGGASVLDHSAEVSAFHAAAAASGLRLGPGADIVVTGPLPDPAMPALYRRAAVLAMPSLVEGFGLAALEALASGTPAVVSRIAPFTEHFSANDVVFADPREQGSIARGLMDAVERGRWDEVPAVCHAFSWTASARRHESLYRPMRSA